MALVAVAMTCEDGVRFTDSFGGCNSYAFATIGTDSHFLGPKFTLMYRLKLFTPSAFYGGSRVGVATNLGLQKRLWLTVEPNGSLFTITGNLDTTACGAVVVFTFTKTQDSGEHSIAWTYDQAGNYAAYWDGVSESSGAAPCADISGPSAADDMFQIAGATNFDGTEIFNIDRVMFSNGVAPASQILDIHTNCSSF